MTSSLTKNEKDTVESICEYSKKLTKDSQNIVKGYVMAMANMEEKYGKRKGTN